MEEEQSKKFKKGDRVYLKLTDEQMRLLGRRSEQAVGILEAYFPMTQTWNLWIEGENKITKGRYGINKTYTGRVEKDLAKI